MEDPIELTHDLGSVVFSPEANTAIVLELERACAVLCGPKVGERVHQRAPTHLGVIVRPFGWWAAVVNKQWRPTRQVCRLCCAAQRRAVSEHTHPLAANRPSLVRQSAVTTPYCVWHAPFYTVGCCKN